MTVRIFGAPPRYHQGPGAIRDIGGIARSLSASACVVVDEGVRAVVAEPIAASLREAGVAARLVPFSGEITYAAIDRLVAAVRADAPGLVVAAGGGKALDVGKGVAVRLGVPVVTVPTIASNDAPTSAIFVVYDENHAVAAVDRMGRNPDAVVVDTALIARAPARFLRAGIGDAVTKAFEARGCRAGTGVTPFGTRPLLTGAAIADAAYATLRAHGAAALEAVERNEVTEDVEATIEACILMSGLGFENGGLSLAHAMTRGLVKARGARDAPHGEQVAYAVVVQCAVERHPEAGVLDLTGFLRGIGLPVRLADLGMEGATPEEIEDIARLTMTAPHIANLPFRVTADDIAAGMRRVEDLAASR
ncbi:glycerol dehydrogenase [Methylobacterium nonmethylotrophicum]|uniref:Glycerol dehydrogenase n=1 Tax=Methylobacterium nonmethylotrophicum TaxID=1141884 RepID=A0A4Z0NUC5_9HYPH|nr:glycerol dehydrogenase [Methylobacterium nonmethylotrophicum]TGE01134.1 glycerol dehydrogenase [Methylobacterium nonmethylotrophicum]